MRRKLIVLMLLACFPWLPAYGQNAAAPPSVEAQVKVDVNRPIGDKWALVVGIGNYASGKVPKLKFAAKDARDFRNFLVNEANFAPDHVRLLLDEQATERRVVSEMGQKFLRRVAKKDDLVVVFFSAHGSPTQEDLSGNFLVAHDSDPDDLLATGINMDDIVAIIGKQIQSDRVLVVLDACHSGVVHPSEKGLARVGGFDAAKLAQGSGQLVICSSNPEESSWESKRYDNGIFTRKLLEGLRMNGKRTTLGEAFPFVQKSVAAEAQEDYAARQTPALKSKWSGNELVLALMPSTPAKVPISVQQELGPDSLVPAVKKPGPVAAAPGVVSQFDKGVKQWEEGNFKLAIDILNGAIAKGANKTDCYYHIGLCYQRLGKLSEAKAAFMQAHRANPKAVLAGYALKESYAIGGTRPATTTTRSTYQQPASYSTTSYPKAATRNNPRNYSNTPGEPVSSGVVIPVTLPTVPANLRTLSVAPYDADIAEYQQRVTVAESNLRVVKDCWQRGRNMLQPYFYQPQYQSKCLEMMKPLDLDKAKYEAALMQEQEALNKAIARSQPNYSGGGSGLGYGQNPYCNTNQQGANYGQQQQYCPTKKYK